MASPMSQFTPAPSDLTSTDSNDDVWDYFQYAEPSEAIKDSSGRKLRYCKLCTKKIWNNPYKTNA